MSDLQAHFHDRELREKHSVKRIDEPGDFESETATIRTWLNRGCVSIERLEAELRKWAEWAKAGL